MPICRALLLSLAINLLAIASVNAVDRTWTGGSANWLENAGTGSWSGNDEPDPDDVAIFNSADVVNLGASNGVMGLTMSGGIDLNTNGFNLDVNGLTQLSGASTNLIVGGVGSQFTSNNITVNSAATLQLNGGTVFVIDEGGNGLLDINSGGQFFGHGILSMNDAVPAATTLITNDGTITVRRNEIIIGAPPASTLTFNANDADTRIDLDGTTGLGAVNVTRNQTLDINIPLFDAFSGSITLSHSATLDVSSPWTMDAGTLNADNGFVDGIFPIPASVSTIAGGTFTQDGGTINVVDPDGTLQFNAPFTMDSGTLANNGLVVFNSSTTIGPTANFTMPTTSSSLTVAANRTVNITQANFNLDGSNAATNSITVNDDGNLIISTGDYDTDSVTNVFDGTVNLTNATIDINTSDAEFVMDGVLNSQASGVKQSLWTGEPLDIGNDLGVLDADVNIFGSQPTQFGAQVDFNSDADLNVASGATAHFLAIVNFNSVSGGNNAEFTGSGELIFSAGVNFNETTLLNMVGGTIDLDGADSIGDTINIDAPLTINAATMSNFGKVNGGGGINTLDINNSVGIGVLTVNLDNANSEWTLNSAGVMNLVNDNTEATLLAGSDVNINGTVNVTGDVRTTARLDLAGTVNINTAGQPLRLGGGDAGSDANTIGGATINGVGQLGADTGKRLQGFGTINTDIAFVGTANLYATGGTLTINGDIVDVNILGTADSTGTLNIVNAWESDGGAGGSIGAVVLNGGVLQGGTITNDNATGLQGNGTINSRVVNNSKIVATNTGTLLVQTVGNDNDWDGATNTGELEALSADLELVDTTMPVPPVRQFSGKVKAINNHRVFANGFALDFNPASTLELQDTAVYQASSSTDIGGTVIIGPGGEKKIQVANNFFLTFETGSTTTLNANLRLVNNNINIEQGAVFNNGGGALIIPDGSHVVADNLTDIGVLVEMSGAFRPGNFNGIGRVNMFDYQQLDAGELYVEIIGTSLNQFDRLVLSGDAVLDGYLNIDIDEISPGVPFVPTVGQTFNIITANTVTGAFDFWDISGMPAGLTFAVTYLGNAVQLEVVNKAVFSADFDDDGDVDLTDLAIWEGAFNLNQLGDANGDNRSDLADWSLWRDQWGSYTGPGGVPHAVPEPGTIALALGALAIIGASGRMRSLLRSIKCSRAACCLVCIFMLQSALSAAPVLSVMQNGIVGGNRQWLVRVAPDPALFTGGTGPVGAELALEVTVGELLSVTKNGVDWPHDLPRKNNPFGVTAGFGLDVNLANDTVFAPVGSKLFNSGAAVNVLTIVTQGTGPTTLKWGGYNITAASPDYVSSRLAQNGINFDGLQGLLSTVPGDFDSDGDVDGADFVAWQTNFPKANSATLTQGDADGDGDVDGADFVVWQTNFPYTPAPGTSPVPEPAAWILAVISLGGVAIRLPRR
jgi:hypothetical protein